MTSQESFFLLSKSAEQTRALGAAFAQALMARSLRCPLVIGLRGELGAGKTTFVSGLLGRLGIVGAIRSPTYTLIEPYEVNGHLIYHLDLYRLADPKELEMLAPRDLLATDAVLLVEWPERGGANLPELDLSVTLSYTSMSGEDASRRIEFRAVTTAGKELEASVERIANELFVSS